MDGQPSGVGGIYLVARLERLHQVLGHAAGSGAARRLQKVSTLHSV